MFPDDDFDEFGGLNNGNTSALSTVGGSGATDSPDAPGSNLGTWLTNVGPGFGKLFGGLLGVTASGVTNSINQAGGIKVQTTNGLSKNTMVYFGIGAAILLLLFLKKK